MKAVKLSVIAVICFTAFFACNSQGDNADNEQADSLKLLEELVDTVVTSKDTNAETEVVEQTTEKDYTAKYICPSRCAKSGSDKPGQCPDCGMELIENPNSEISKKK